MREFTQTRHLAERTIYYLQRAPGLINMQMERFTDQAAATQEAKTLLGSLQSMSLIGSATNRLVTSLPQLLATERQAFLAQLFRELSTNQDTVSALSGDLRATPEAGTETANALQGALTTLDRITARIGVGDGSPAANPGRPFDINEYAEALRQATATASELNTLAQSLQAASPVLRTASRSASADIEGVLNHAFLLVLALVVIGISGTLAAALAYRTLLPRLARGSAR